MPLPIPPAHEISEVMGKPRAEWPTTFAVRWDYSPENLYLADDGADPEDYGLGEYQIGEADLAEIDQVLHIGSRRTAAELWTFAPHKVARAILHWSAGGVMTPPLLDVNMGCLVIIGGNNRIAVSRADGQQRLPFLYPAEKAALFADKLKTFSPLLHE